MNKNERPILFSAPMVRAILAGTKTQTRRVVKPQPDIVAEGGKVVGVSTAQDRRYGRLGKALRCPYGATGDRLWVREAWRDWSESAWHYAADGLVLPKQRDRELASFLAHRAPFTWESYRWRPSIHMPRAASRITLEITGVRVERLQDISEADAEAEGVEPANEPNPLRWQHYSPHGVAYAQLWDQINGHGSWDANPWVWVVEFRRANEKTHRPAALGADHDGRVGAVEHVAI